MSRESQLIKDAQVRRYQSDPMFHTLVDVIVTHVKAGNITLADYTQAIGVADELIHADFWRQVKEDKDRVEKWPEWMKKVTV